MGFIDFFLLPLIWYLLMVDNDVWVKLKRFIIGILHYLFKLLLIELKLVLLLIFIILVPLSL